MLSCEQEGPGDYGALVSPPVAFVHAQGPVPKQQMSREEVASVGGIGNGMEVVPLSLFLHQNRDGDDHYCFCCSRLSFGQPFSGIYIKTPACFDVTLKPSGCLSGPWFGSLMSRFRPNVPGPVLYIRRKVVFPSKTENTRGSISKCVARCLPLLPLAGSRAVIENDARIPCRQRSCPWRSGPPRPRGGLAYRTVSGCDDKRTPQSESPETRDFFS